MEARLTHSPAFSSSLEEVLTHLLPSPLVPQVPSGFHPPQSLPRELTALCLGWRLGCLAGRWRGTRFLLSSSTPNGAWGQGGGAQACTPRGALGQTVAVAVLPQGWRCQRRSMSRQLNRLHLGGDKPVAHRQSRYLVCLGAQV